MKTIKEIATDIVEVFEDFLDERNVTIPNPERDQDSNAAIIYGTQYGNLVDTIASAILTEVDSTTEPIREIINVFLRSKPKNTALKDFIDGLEQQIDKARSGWRMHWALARTILRAFRALIYGCYDLTEKENELLKNKVIDILDGEIGDWLNCCHTDIVDFNETGIVTNRQMVSFLKGISDELRRYHKQESPVEYYLLLVGCVDRDFSVRKFEVYSEAERAMMDAMIQDGGMDPELVANNREWTSPEESFGYSCAWAWTSSNRAEHAECSWQILTFSKNFAGALLAKWEDADLNISTYTSVAEAQRTMRKSFREKGGESEKDAIDSYVEDNADNYNFKELSASLTVKNGHTIDWQIFPINVSPDASAFLSEPRITVAQELYISDKELGESNGMTKNYTPDMDSVPTGNFLVPYLWEKDFGGGWAVQISVIEPVRSVVPYCEAVLLRNGEIVHRSVRHSRVDGTWGLRYDNKLFQIEVKAV